ncbi:MAG: hypothetical protein IJ649_03670 [Oscillospiraceae bacterium]|nr:hypothetical protein [Oscillospiraceae bacterium]
MSVLAKEFGMASKELVAILKNYTDTVKGPSQVLDERELSILFEYLTQKNQVDIATIFADTYQEKKEEPPKAEPKQEAAPKIKIIGQLFDTYWLAEYEDSLYIIDQHAAHEKVMYERIVARFRDRQITTQAISPPIVLTLSALEESTLKEYGELFESTGFEIEPFGGSEYQLRGAPDALLGVPDRELFIEMIDSLASGSAAPSKQVLLDKMATMACKSAVKGGNRLSRPEAQALLDEMMTLENPYNCPHGRPTVIRMTRTELEKKFKRIV